MVEVQANEEYGPLGFRYTKELGAGQYGEVWEVERGNTKYALKRMMRGVHTAEVEPWCVGLSHSNIIRCHGYLLDAEYQYIILELHGDDLYGYIDQHESYPGSKDFKEVKFSVIFCGN